MTTLETRSVKLFNVNREPGDVQLKMEYSGYCGYLMAYERIEPIPSRLYCKETRTHQFVLNARSISAAHSPEQLSIPGHNVAASFTIGAGHKHLGVGVGKHFYWAEHQIWSQAPYGNVSRLIRVNGAPMARLHVVLDENLSRVDNIMAIEDAIGDIIGKHYK